MHFLEEAEKLIRIRSMSNDGNEEIASYLRTLLNKLGFKSSLQEVSHSLEGVSKRQFNLFGILGDPLVDRKTKKGLLLNTHLDTVGPGLTAFWTETAGDPFKATIKDGKIFGLGTADVKLDFLCKLKACERYLNRALKMPIYLVGTAGEEIGMIGAKFLIKSLALNPKYVVVGEPSDLAVVSSHKAYAVYEIAINYNQRERDARGHNTRIALSTLGKSAHASYPHLGQNAIKRMLELVQKIKQANFQIKLAKLQGGDLTNKVPDTASAEFYLSAGSFDDFKRYFTESLTDPSIQVEFGGLGESGMKFIPDNVLDAIFEVQTCLLRLESDLLAARDETYNPPASTINFGRLIHKPDGLVLCFDIRLLPVVSPEVFDERLKTAVQTMNARFPNLILKATRTRFNPALNMSENSELVKVALESQKQAGCEVRLDKKATSTEAAQYFVSGYDAIVFGPGKSVGNSHSPNEHNLIDHLDKAVHFYDRLIERICI